MYRPQRPGYGDAHMAENEEPDADFPPMLTRLTFHGPLSEGRAVRLTERLTRTTPRTVLDIGCGWGELMLRILGAVPEATGLGLDTDEGDLARGREAAKVRGLGDRVTFVRESGVGTTRGPADLVLCVGASHALSEAQPPEHTPAALQVLRRLVTPGGRVLLGEGFWQRPPAGAGGRARRCVWTAEPRAATPHATLAQRPRPIYTGRPADVAQLARASACHAEGRGFESLHPLRRKRPEASDERTGLDP